VARWLADLDAEAFEDRDRASAELEKQGAAVVAALRKALEGQPPAETRRRIGLLLAKLEALPGVNLGVLVVPDGVRVLGPDELLARNREGLKSDNVRARSEVATLMMRFGADPAAAAVLMQMLDDKQAGPPHHAVEVLGRMGKAAVPALPALRAGLANTDGNVRITYQTAIKAIEAAKDDPDAAERLEKAKAARDEIGRFVKARAGKAME
jgi:HEAT repeat protein